ncbi:hypothetical protein PoB_000931900 [Plakobranchus ocellatus]|uniref:Uncharacterized protein n=1 Tax=Plakobranchus ocellatus TaxID=259542 RepID=A0AAV3YII6_9GAST|nr:hypothetical protein PoB_000931900 [Plakobranchus ocellatus]
MAPPFPLPDRATGVRPGCKTQRMAPTLQQVADLVCARIEEREYFKICIVGQVNCCLQCGPTLTVRYPPTSSPDNGNPFPLSNRAIDVRPGCKTQRIASTLRQVTDLVCAPTKEREYFKICIVVQVNCCLRYGPMLLRHQSFKLAMTSRVAFSVGLR